MTSPIRLYLTGGSGFIGKAICSELAARNYDLLVPVRNDKTPLPANVTKLHIKGYEDFSSKLLSIKNLDVVIHAAAIAHVSGVALDDFLKVNTDTTIQLAKTAASVGVKRFVFLSSIGVNGISNTMPFCVEHIPAPKEPYAVSKLEAEIGLRKIAEETGMEIVIIRPPLVYGYNAPGNFGKLAKLAIKNLPLPLGAINNKRSLVALANLVDLIVTCVNHPNAANKTFLVSDDHDISTTELLEMMIRASGKKPRLIPVPLRFLKLAGKLTGKQTVIDRLCGNLQVDISYTKETLDWKPPISVEEGIKRCFEKF